MKNMREGQIVVYCQKNSDGEIFRVGIGKIKRIDEAAGKAFVYYSEGGTAAGTSIEDLYPIGNDYVVKETLNSMD